MEDNPVSSYNFTFFCLSSGSCGNCYYLGSSDYGILVDAGLGPRVIKKRLTEYGIDITTIYAILVTHEHFDHIKSVGYLAEKLNIPVYATEKVHQGIANCPGVKHALNGSKRFIDKNIPFKIADFKITAFDVPHDSSENTGYFFEFGYQKLTIATDVGAITDEVSKFIRKANHLVIESNYDEELLECGNYPYHLKERIKSGTGHLSNRQTGDFLANNYNPALKNIWLCHLSGDNNTPELAYNTVKNSLIEKGVEVGKDVNLDIFQRNRLSKKINL